MYVVLTPAGFSFICVEVEDAVSLADNLHGDLGSNVIVINKDNDEVAYQTGN